MADQILGSQGPVGDGTTSTGGPVSPVASLDPALSPDAGVISTAEHEAALHAETRRRAGQERAHQKETGALRSRIDELESRMEAMAANAPLSSPSLSSQDRRDARDLLARMERGDLDRDQVLREVVLTTASWAEHNERQEKSRIEQSRTQRAVDDAIADLEDAYPDVTIPRAALNLSSPEAVRASAERYLSDQRVIALEKQVAALTSRSTTAEEGAAMAATRTRQELGATRTSTSTGLPPTTLPEQEEEIAKL